MSNPHLFYDNRFSDATPAASTTAAGYSVLNVRDWRPYTWWKPTAGPSTITVDCASAKSADYGLVYAEAGTYQVRGSTDNFSASDVLLGTITLTAAGCAFVSFAASSYRYWRLTSTTGTPAVAIAAIGTALELPSQLSDGFDPIGRKIVSDTNRSESGYPLGRVTRFEEWSDRINLPYVSLAWIRGDFKTAWEAHLRDDPFVFAWDPGNYPDELHLVTVKDSFESPHRLGGYVTLNLDLTGLAV